MSYFIDKKHRKKDPDKPNTLMQAFAAIAAAAITDYTFANKATKSNAKLLPSTSLAANSDPQDLLQPEIDHRSTVISNDQEPAVAEAISPVPIDDSLPIEIQLAQNTTPQQPITEPNAIPSTGTSGTEPTSSIAPTPGTTPKPPISEMGHVESVLRDDASVAGGQEVVASSSSGLFGMSGLQTLAAIVGLAGIGVAIGGGGGGGGGGSSSSSSSSTTTSETVEGDTNPDALNDPITTGSGNDIVRPGQGADTVNTGAGDDIVVVVGTTTAEQYTTTDITAPGGNTGLNVSSVLTLDKLNGNTTSEAATGETIDGGTGNDTLLIYGDVDLTGVTLTNISKLQVNSTLTIAATQLEALNLTEIAGNGTSSKIKIVGSTGQSVDLSTVDLSRIQNVEITTGVTAILNQTNVDAIKTITGTGSIQAASGSDNLDLTNTGIDSNVSVLDQEGETDATQGGANHFPTEITLSSDFIAENELGAVVGELAAIDPDLNTTATDTVTDTGTGTDTTTDTTTDTGTDTTTDTTTDTGTTGTSDTHTFSVKDTNNRFQIVGTQLKLKPNIALDHETDPPVTVTITATDSNGLTKTQDFTIQVDDINEAPTAITLSSRIVNENAEGAIIGDLSNDDPDADDAHTYSLDDASKESFEVFDDPDTGPQLKLKHGVALDYEDEATGSTVDVIVTATDSKGLAKEQTFTLEVQNVNEKPTLIELSNTTIAENATEAVIGSLSTTDPDTNDTHTYAVVDDERFEVVENRLKLKADTALDHEAGETIEVKIKATDNGGLTHDQFFNIQVNDINEEPTAINLSPSTSTVDENVDGAIIGNLTITDPDAADTHTFSVDDIRFEIVDDQLKLKAGETLDYETAPISSVDSTKKVVKLTVTATDSGGLSKEQDFTIQIKDTNDAPTAIRLSNRSVEENIIGGVIGNVFITDLDDGDTHTYSVSDPRFEVVDNPDDNPDQGPQLKLKHGIALDYETESLVNITITATDSGDLTKDQTFVIDVYDINENATDLTLSNITIAENADGAIIGNVSITDPSDNGTYSYVVNDLRFEVANGQLKLKAGDTLDHEDEPAINLTITATDTDGRAKDEDFTIYVNNVNEAPTDIGLSARSIKENEPGAIIGNLATFDPDADDTHTYSLDDASKESFEVFDDPDTGPQLKLKHGIALDYEDEATGTTVPTVNVTITSTDSAGLSIDKTFTINVISETGDTNEAPTNITLDDNNVTENIKGDVVGNLTVTDPNDPEGNGTYTFTLDTTSFEQFQIVDSKLKLRNGISLDFETQSSIDVTVTAIDSGGLSLEKTFTIDVEDVAEAIKGTNADNTIEGTPGVDIVRGFLGQDMIDTGGGDDFIVVVGLTAFGPYEYHQEDIDNPKDAQGNALDVDWESLGIDLNSVAQIDENDINKGNINDRWHNLYNYDNQGNIIEINPVDSVDEIARFEYDDVTKPTIREWFYDNIDGGEGTDYLIVYGDVALTYAPIANVEIFHVVPQTITIKSQADLATYTNGGYYVDDDGRMTGGGESRLNIENPNTNNNPAITIDLSEIDLSGFVTLDIDENVTVILDNEDIKGTQYITGDGTIQASVAENTLTLINTNDPNDSYPPTPIVVSTSITVNDSSGTKVTSHDGNVIGGEFQVATGDAERFTHPDPLEGSEDYIAFVNANHADNDVIINFNTSFDKIDLSNVLTYQDQFGQIYVSAIGWPVLMTMYKDLVHSLLA
ncbi:hypothetical protein TI05_08585 [Achromatium sp. WMS3]|nr:hypothetical protein TI05_08585 [Achromatium sp. WMS3]